MASGGRRAPLWLSDPERVAAAAALALDEGPPDGVKHELKAVKARVKNKEARLEALWNAIIRHIEAGHKRIVEELEKEREFHFAEKQKLQKRRNDLEAQMRGGFNWVCPSRPRALQLILQLIVHCSCMPYSYSSAAALLCAPGCWVRCTCALCPLLANGGDLVVILWFFVVFFAWTCSWCHSDDGLVAVLYNIGSLPLTCRYVVDFALLSSCIS